MTKWYVLQSKPNKEEFVLQQLSIHNIDVYYPCIRIQPINPRSRKTKPCFPGYLFINTNLDTVGITVLKWIPGAIGMVDFGGELATVPDDLLQAIRNHMDRINNTNSETHRKFIPGDKVIIQSGPFAGYQAVFDTFLPGHERVRVLLQMLQDRQIKIELSGVRVEQVNISQSNN